MNVRISLIVLLLTIIVRPELHAQANCAAPPGCILNFGTDLGSGSTGWVGAQMNSGTNWIPDWGVLFGTPHLGFGMGMSTGIKLESNAAGNQGAFACYNFQQGVQYNICIWTYNSVNQPGNLILEAHNGTTWETILSGAHYVPLLGGTDNATNATNSYRQMNIPFTCNGNYTQLRIYTTSSVSSAGVPYTLTFDDVQVMPIPTITATKTVVSECESTILTGSDPNMTYTWSGPGLSTNSGTSVRATPPATTTYQVTYTNNCWISCERTSQINITVTPSVNAVASPSSITSCQSSTLTATSATNMPVTWMPATGLSSSRGPVVNASPCSTKTYTANFYCALNNQTYQRPVTVNVQGQPGYIINHSPNIGCNGTFDLEYVDTASNPACSGNTYLWTGPNGLPQRTTSRWIQNAAGAVYSGAYTLVVTSANGCKETYTETVNVNCCELIADFEVEGANPVKFINTTTIGGPPNWALSGEWHWDFGDGATSTTRNPAHLFLPLADYEVCLTSVAITDNFGNTCCDKVCKQIHVPDVNDCEPRAAFDYRVIDSDPNNIVVQLLDRSAYAGNGCYWRWWVDGQPYLIDGDTSDPQNRYPTVTLPPPTPTNPPNPPIRPYIYRICLEATNCYWFHGQRCASMYCEDIVIP